jgi:steroid 5-alpha reductase family enzyme
LKQLSAPGFIVLFLIYAIATAVGIFVFLALTDYKLLIGLFAADIVATLFVWLIGLLLKNSSVYDPYWSVAPVVMAPLVAAYLKIMNAGVFLLLGVIMFWGIRLTVHWAFTFKNLSVQDWRYTQLKKSNPRLWFIINLFGIHLVPTIVVFLVMIPAFQFIMDFTFLNTGIILSACLCLFAVIIQIFSDTQMRRFRKIITNTYKVNREGLWKYIRHPNYLGEILMWWGVYFMLLSARPDLWLAIVGPMVNTMMFIFISIPLMERRQLDNKPGYAQYKACTGMLFPKIF